MNIPFSAAELQAIGPEESFWDAPDGLPMKIVSWVALQSEQPPHGAPRSGDGCRSASQPRWSDAGASGRRTGHYIYQNNK